MCMLKLVFLNNMQEEEGTSLYSVHASQKVDVRDIFQCDYKVMPNCKHALRTNKFQKEEVQKVSPYKPCITI